MKKDQCPICSGKGQLFAHLSKKGYMEEYDYYVCNECGSIFLQADVLEAMDNGYSLIKYEDSYWEMETASAVDRCYGSALARMAETMYYVKIPVEHFLDIGTGTGLLLDAIEKYLPSKKQIFYGVEKFPPQKKGGGAQKALTISRVVI